MKYFIFSDVHGYFNLLIKELEEKGFNLNDENHILIGLGDYFDRGNESKELFDFLLELDKKERFFGIRGNHDDMLIDFLKNNPNNLDRNIFNFKNNGLNKTIKSLKGHYITNSELVLHEKREKLINTITRNNPELLTFLTKLKDEIHLKTNEKTYVLTHAGFKKTNKLSLKNNETEFFKNHESIFLKENYLEEEFIPYNWSNLNDIKSFLKWAFNKKDNVYVFGHWGARDLNMLLNPNDFSEEENLFGLGNVLGIDATTHSTKKINIITLKTKNKPKIIR